MSQNAKICIECRKKIPLCEFYHHPQMADGYAQVCIKCHKIRMKKRRLLNPQVQAYDLKRSTLPKRKIQRQAAAKRWDEKNPDGYRAHYAVHNALRDGKIKKMPCMFCATTKVEAHHKDYSKPLDVIWLCTKCHRRLYAVFPELRIRS